MSPESKFIKHLMSKGLFPFEKIISDGEPYQFTDARSGRQFKYVIYEKEFRLIEITRKAA